MSTFRAIALVILALPLSACSTTPEPDCPQPPTILLEPLPPLEPLPAPLPLDEAVAAWLTDVAAYERARARMAALQEWGRGRCWAMPPRKPN